LIILSLPVAVAVHQAVVVQEVSAKHLITQ
jgi:hypothetical protein